MQQRPSQREYWSGKVGGEWAAHADRIDSMLAPIADATFAAANFKQGERVLDIGCGAGATSIEIATRVSPSGNVIGVDISPPLLHVARERAKLASANVEFLEADASAADLGEPFDVAFSRFGVMFFEAPTAAFAHIRKSLRPNGRLAFACWRSVAENVWATAPISAVEPMLQSPLPPTDPDAPGPYAFADASKVERILGDAGWRNIALAPWDGAINIGGGGSLTEIADFVLSIGPCARAVADQNLDPAEARARIVDHLAPHHRDNGVALAAACWIVTAQA